MSRQDILFSQIEIIIIHIANVTLLWKTKKGLVKENGKKKNTCKQDIKIKEFLKIY